MCPSAQTFSVSCFVRSKIGCWGRQDIPKEAAQSNAAQEEHEKNCDCKVAVAVAITDRRGCGAEKKGVAGIRAALPGAQNTSAPPGQRCSDPTCPVGLPMRAGGAAGGVKPALYNVASDITSPQKLWKPFRRVLETLPKGFQSF